MNRPTIAFFLLFLFAGCAGGPPPQTPGPMQQWIGMPFDSVRAAVGEPSGGAGHATITAEAAASARGEKGYAWVVGDCRVRMYFSKAMLMEYADLSGDCPNDAMIAAGWFHMPKPDGLKATYAKFFQTYRAWTEAVEVMATNTSSTLELTFVGGFNKNKPNEIASGMLIRLPQQQTNAQTSQRDVTGIPLSVLQTGEARLLLNDSDIYKVQASQQIPLNVAAAGSNNYLLLSMSLSLLHRIGRARSVGVLLPSGAEFSLPEDYLQYVRNLAALLDMPDVVVHYAETGKIN